ARSARLHGLATAYRLRHVSTFARKRRVNVRAQLVEIHHLLEGDFAPVQKERRRALHAARLPDVPVLRHAHPGERTVYVLREAVNVETKLLRVFDEERARCVGLTPLRLLLVEQI